MLPLRRWDDSRAAQCCQGTAWPKSAWAMTAAGRRRAAVISADGRLLGLLCLKVSRAGFCSDQDVRARALGEADLLSSAAQALTDLGNGPTPGPANRV